MSNKVTFSIDGLNELDKGLKSLDEIASKKVLRKAAREGMHPVLTQAKQQISSRWGDKSGALEASVALRVRSPKSGKWAEVIANVGVFNIKEWAEVAALYYKHGYMGAPTLAYWFEHGVRPHSLGKKAKAARGKGQESGAMHPGISPKPVLRPTMDSNIEIINARVSNVLGNEIDKILSKAKR